MKTIYNTRFSMYNECHVAHGPIRCSRDRHVIYSITKQCSKIQAIIYIYIY